MTEETGIAVVPATTEVRVPMTREELDLVREMLCPEATDLELIMLGKVCERTGLDPFARQIYPIKRYNSQQKKKVLSIEASIDGLRLVGQRTGRYAGQRGPFWCGPDGLWTDVWLAPDPPAAAKVGVLASTFTEPLWAVAKWAEYVQTYDRDGKTITAAQWERMPALMLAKCAEALALRKAFPAELSGIYTKDEMGQTDHDEQSGPVGPSPAARLAMNDLAEAIKGLPDEDRDPCKTYLREQFGPADELVEVDAIRAAIEVVKGWSSSSPADEEIAEGEVVEGAY